MARLALLGSLVLALALTASASASGRPQSDAVYRSAAARICTTAADDVTSAVDNAVKRYGRTSRALRVSLVASLSIGRTRYEALRALEPPGHLKALHMQVLSLFSRGLGVLAGVVKDVQAGADPKTELPKLNPSVELGKKESAVWRKLGVRACE